MSIFDFSPVMIVKPTLNCNLNCKYCYENNNPYKDIQMNYNTLKNVIVKTSEYIHTKKGPEETILFIWHGGEPNLLGLKFYKDIVQIQKKIGLKYFHNGIQSNGTLINNEMVDFFQRFKFSVGVSLDGGHELHDYQRPYPTGRGSYEDVIRGISLLKERDIPIFGGALSVFTNKSLINLDSFYKFFRSNRLDLKISFFFYEGGSKNYQKELGLNPKELGNAMVYLFDKWFYDKKTSIMIDLFVDILSGLILGNLSDRVQCYR